MPSIPSNGFIIWFDFRALNLPLIIAEIRREHWQAKNRYRYRMLLRPIVLACLVFYLRRPQAAACPSVVDNYLSGMRAILLDYDPGIADAELSIMGPRKLKLKLSSSTVWVWFKVIHAPLEIAAEMRMRMQRRRPRPRRPIRFWF
ncbi:hypothetical protein GALMADRAFT_227708 [Galerina marginata CBS 339.88]|uniref:Uncharacterized protein n=1 Tax=Galerina marginata (strain CBS 339.88) TaxID=685588 RepID=A0A067SSU9_GALM3|nr:hypothetical protein GALMADRAFT_227708 [Galerina marginata CBS 339.88]